MAGEEETIEKIFQLEFSLAETNKIKIEVPMKFPFPTNSINELVQRIISSFNLPIFTEKDIYENLEKFIAQENYKLVQDSVTINPDKVEDHLKEWEQAFREETLQYNPPEVVSDDEVFAEAYHALVHSPLLGSVLRKESALNSAIREMYRLKQLELENLQERQTQEMSSAVTALTLNDSSNSSREVNQLAAVHFDDVHLAATRWDSLIESENLKQKREFRDWIVQTYEEYYIQSADIDGENISNSNRKGFKKKHSVRFDDSLMISYGDDSRSDSTQTEPMLQESFTIHLGSQMKQMYNIRVLCCHPIEFLKFKNESSREISPQRIQTAISLYSTDLSGLVLLIDPDVPMYSGITKDLVELCHQTTEFHFDRVESQVESRPDNLKPGDFLVTKHSNLNGTHVIFHLVVDQHVLRRSEINSRDPVILGLRNILKMACLNDITTITLPALLVHEMAEFMTVQWCNRRAELVYKCVKGFMIEMASWGGAEMKNLQFLAPKDISEDVFNSLAAMLPNIFRVSNPLRLSTSSSTQNLQQ